VTSVTEDPTRYVVISHAAVAEQRSCGRIMPVVRGVLMPDYFGSVVVPGYQRRPIMNGSKDEEIFEAMDPDTGIGIPDDTSLCVRSAKHRIAGGGEIIIPTSELIVLDGHQRFNGGWARINQKLKCIPLGVKVFLGTTLEEEIQLFYQMNRLQTKVSTHTLLRNAGETPAKRALLELGELPGFPQIQMDADRQEGDLITTHKLYTVAIMLHGHYPKSKFEELNNTLDAVGDYIGTERMASNVRTFFEVLERCFGVPVRVKGEDTALPNPNAQYMYRQPMLYAMARLFGRHNEFWDSRASNTLQVNAVDITKLRNTRTRTIEAILANRRAYQHLVDMFRGRFISRAHQDIALTERFWNYPKPEED
jgi:hypothetical protein